MSTAKEVMERYHAKVPFPITPAKIRAAGYDVRKYLKGLSRELDEAEDSLDPQVQGIIRKIHLMQWTTTVT